MLSAIMLVLRGMLTWVGALALLYTLSYPDSILPPTPDIEYVQGITVYDLKPFMWLIPLLFMELVSGCGSRRNAVWFFALGATLVMGIIAWPVLQANAPEWVHPTLPFEDAKLAVGLGYFTIIFFGSYVFRRVLLNYLFRDPPSDAEDPLAMDAAVLDPKRALTVREIMANPVKSKPRFLFGDADQGLIDRFYELVRRMMRMRAQKCYAEVFGLVALALWFWCYPQPDETAALHRDLRVMYEHTQLPNGAFKATHRAVHAAYRVMKHISDHESFAGMSFAEAERWLHIAQAPAAYRKQLRDDRDISLPSVDDTFESRTRFLTVQDGRRIAVLYIRTNAKGDRINISEVQDAGWNAVMDDIRRRYGSDISTGFFGR